MRTFFKVFPFDRSELYLSSFSFEWSLDLRFHLSRTQSAPWRDRFPPCCSPPLQENLKKDIWWVRCSTSAPVSFPLHDQSVVLCSIVFGAIPGRSRTLLTGITSSNSIWTHRRWAENRTANPLIYHSQPQYLLICLYPRVQKCQRRQNN